MAHAITFKPREIDPREELMKQVAAAPQEHAEALLVGWQLLQTAHDKGILDLAVGMIGGKDIIAGKLAEGANTPEAIAGIRNAIAMARILAAVDPDMLHRMARALDEESQKKLAQEKQAALHGHAAAKSQPAPGLWQILKSATSEDARRGIGFTLGLLNALGRASKGKS